MSKFLLKLIRADQAIGSIPTITEKDMIEDPVIQVNTLINICNDMKIQYCRRLFVSLSVSKVVCSYGQGYILQNDGVLWCFEGYYGSLGDGTFDYNELLNPVNPSGGLKFNDIVAGYEAPLGLVGGNIYWWGWHAGGDNSTGCSGSDNNSTCPWHNVIPAVGASGYNFSSLCRANTWNTYIGAALDGVGNLYCWGYQVFCQIPDGTGDCEYAPIPVHTPILISHTTSWIHVEMGWVCGFGIDYDGKLFMWGNDRYGSGGLGNNPSSWVYSPRQIGTDTDWLKVSAGEYGAIALKTNGELWAWGWNESCYLGFPVDGNIYTPTKIADGPFVDIKVGYYCAAALDMNGNLWTWGYNDWVGALGLGYNDGTILSTPTQITSISNITSFDVGESRMIATDGSDVWIWGLWDCYYASFGSYPTVPYNFWSV